MIDITQEVGYDIRYTQIADEPLVRQWLLIPEIRKWYPPSSDGDVDGFVRNWVGFSRYNASLTALYNNEVVGVGTIFLMPYIKVAHLCMMYMVVAPDMQRKGVGTSLIRNIKHLAKTRFRLESMHCEVWDGCPITELLKKQGFKEIVRQENFVKLPDEKGFRARLIIEADL